MGNQGSEPPPQAVGPQAGYYEPVTRDVKKCKTVDAFRDQIVGYDVTYKYQGRTLHTRLPYNPGSTLSIAVSVTPDNQRLSQNRY
jgi:uncharacterized protein YcfJ